MSNIEGMYSACRELLRVERSILKKTEHAYSAEKATKAKSDSILDPPDWMFDAYSPPLEDLTFKPLRAGINPAPTPEAHAKK